MSIQDELRLFILTNFLFTNDAGALDDSASLMKTGVIDSTGILEIILHLEETYGIKMADDEMVPENLDSVSALCSFIARKRAA